jgi:hemerythrin-like metal-binding protein
MMRGQGESIAGPLLSKLKEYTREHFPVEESLLESVNFPKLAQHREYHRNLIEKLEEFDLRHENGDHTMYPPFLRFLRDWQICHLFEQDREYIPYLAMKKIN